MDCLYALEDTKVIFCPETERAAQWLSGPHQVTTNDQLRVDKTVGLLMIEAMRKAGMEVEQQDLTYIRVEAVHKRGVDLFGADWLSTNSRVVSVLRSVGIKLEDRSVRYAVAKSILMAMYDGSQSKHGKKTKGPPKTIDIKTPRYIRPAMKEQS